MGIPTGRRILMLLEKGSYADDRRVSQQAETLVQHGYNVRVISPSDPGQPRYENLAGVHVYRFPGIWAGGGFLSYLWEYGYSFVAISLLSLFVCCRHGFDVVHVHNPPDILVVVMAFYKLFGKQVIYDHCDLCPEMYEVLFAKSGDVVHRALLTLEKYASRTADHVLVTNESYKAMNMTRNGVAPERITIVRNGPDLNRIKPVEPDPALRRPQKTNLCYVGEMGFHDGLEHLLRALSHLIFDLNRTDVWCLLVGSGNAWQHVQRLSQEMKLSDYIRFTGMLPHAEVTRYISSSDICLSPEPFDDYNSRSTMIKLMEYMAVGKPVVAFDLHEHRVTAQNAALYAKVNDEMDFARQIAVLMDDVEQREALGQIGRARIESELAWRHQTGQLLKAYAALEI